MFSGRLEGELGNEVGVAIEPVSCKNGDLSCSEDVDVEFVAKSVSS